VITSSDADQAFGFARTLGWRVLWAVNLGNGSSSDDADEAAYVYQTAADVLLGLEIGNEPNVYSRNGLRSSTYTFSDYAAEWQTYANAIQSRVPSAALTGPAAVGADVTGTWILPFAQQFGSRIAVLTQHYYALSPTAAPGSPDAPTLANLLGDAMRMAEDSDGAELQQEAQKQRIAWRMSETNSCFGATPAGVSDALAAALWGIDYMFTMAGRNATGVNFHDVPATGGITPIKITGEEITPMPLYYATLMFHAASKGHLVPADVAANGVNLTAYGVLDDDFTLRVTVINKDETRGAALSIAPGAGYRSALVMRLSGPALTATSGVTLGGASVAADGSWSPRQLENGSVSGGRFQTTVPSGSAALVTFAQGSPRGRCRGNCTSKGILAENPVLRGSHDVYHPKNDVP